MSRLDGQQDLVMPVHQVALVDDDVVIAQPTLTRAIVVCGDLAGLEDKESAHAAGVDNSTWSKIKSGQANFPHLRLRSYQQACGYWLPLQWQARDAGFRLVRLETELERQLREEREARLKAEEKLAWAESVLQGRVSR